jgi:hypothetical protein
MYQFMELMNKQQLHALENKFENASRNSQQMTQYTENKAHN